MFFTNFAKRKHARFKVEKHMKLSTEASSCYTRVESCCSSHKQKIKINPGAGEHECIDVGADRSFQVFLSTLGFLSSSRALASALHSFAAFELRIATYNDTHNTRRNQCQSRREAPCPLRETHRRRRKKQNKKTPAGCSSSYLLCSITYSFPQPPIPPAGPGRLEPAPRR